MEAIIYKVINLKTLTKKKIKLNISNSLFKNIISHHTLFCSTNKNLSTLLPTKFRLCNKFVAEKNPVSNFNFYIQKEKGSDSKIGCIINSGHGKNPSPNFNFYIQKDKYPI